jgi:NitT/TauT family transport system ATP-binding protein
MNQSPAALSVDQVTHTFRSRGRDVLVLQELSLSVAEGEIVTIVGPSGCGKSTLLNVLAGLLVPSSGRVSLAGDALDGPTRRIGYITQQDTLLPWRTLQRNVEYLLELRKVDKATRQERAKELIERVGLGGFEHHYPHEMSGGMRQRAMIIRALAADPEVLLLDEPFGALDAQTRGQLQNELTELHQQTNKTMVFVTHDLMEAVALGDRVVVLTGRPASVNAVHDVPLGSQRDVFTVHRDPRFREIHAAVTSEIFSGAVGAVHRPEEPAGAVRSDAS